MEISLKIASVGSCVIKKIIIKTDISKKTSLYGKKISVCIL